jgi:signal transduction histidine kinase
LGARAFETTLRRGLLLLVTPAVLGVGVAAVVVTAEVLEGSDRDAARARAAELVVQLRAELDEGDEAEEAAGEVLRGTDASFRVLLRGDRMGVGRATPAAIPPRLAELRRGECAKAEDDTGKPWLACAAGQGTLEAVAALPIDAHRRVVVSLAEWMLAAVVLAIVGIAAAARFAVRSPLEALGALVRWSEHVMGGDATEVPPTAEILEFERLARAFEMLVKHLMDALAREQSASAYIAHELRTPLTALRVELEGLGANREEAVSRMLGDIDCLARVIDAILVLSAPGAERSSSGVANVVNVVNVADLARELAPAGALVEAPDEALIDADAALVELALHNLLENAQKYSGSPARAVRVTRSESGVRIAVIDDGPGLDEGALVHMFDRYWRGGDGAGTGLGLALVRAVAERYGGAAEAARNADGRGLEVAMTFGRVLGWHSDPPGAEETTGPG